MTVNVQVFEETGAIAGGRGSVVTEITNLNWKSSADPAQVYYLNPVKRPSQFGHDDQEFIGDQNNSYKRFIFFKVSGTYSIVKDFRIIVSVSLPEQAKDCDLFYKMTNVYEVPNQSYDGSMLYVPKDKDIIIHPMLNGSSPNLATTRPIVMGPNATFYTNYFVTQMRVPGQVDADKMIGNTEQYKIRYEVREFE